MLGSISEKAKETNYQLIFIHVEDSSPTELDLNFLREKRISGLIYLSLDPCEIEYQSIFDEVKTVFVNCHCARGNYSSVQADNEQGLYNIANLVFHRPWFTRSLLLILMKVITPRLSANRDI